MWLGRSCSTGLMCCHVATSSHPPFPIPVTPPLFPAPFHPGAFAMRRLSSGVPIRAAHWLCCCEPCGRLCAAAVWFGSPLALGINPYSISPALSTTLCISPGPSRCLHHRQSFRTFPWTWPWMCVQRWPQLSLTVI